jgi:hypothetical protein
MVRCYLAGPRRSVCWTGRDLGRRQPCRTLPCNAQQGAGASGLVVTTRKQVLKGLDRRHRGHFGAVPGMISERGHSICISA